jgi:FG-GAP-like repeat/Secretion system C-terminal sorting domain
MRRSGLLVLFVIFGFAANVSAQVEFTELTLDNGCVGAASIYGCDLDGDLDLDVLVAENEGNRVSWYRNEGGTPIVWTKFVIRTGMAGCHSVHANDIDGDGALDVLATTYGASIYWIRNDGGDPIVWTSFVITSAFSQAHEVYSVDIDNDGDIDVLGAASAANRISLWTNEGGDPIEWTEQVIDATCEMAKSVHAADVNDDGHMDIISAGIMDNDVVWYENTPGFPIEWTEHTIDSNFGGAHRVEGVDLDQDGDTDVLGAAYLWHQLSWWRNEGGDPPTWTEQVIVWTYMNACVAQAADMDGDGILDVVGTAQGDGRVAWFRNDGEDEITWAEHDLTTDFNRPWPLYVCDIDDDGDNDVLSASSYNGSNELALWRNEGEGLFVEERSLFPAEFELSVYPNPFNAQTSISIQLPQSGDLMVEVFDVTGRRVAILADGSYSSGKHSLTVDGSEWASGVYFVQASTTEGLLGIQKVVMMK